MILVRIAATSTLTSTLTERLDRMGLFPSGNDAPLTRRFANWPPVSTDKPPLLGNHRPVLAACIRFERPRRYSACSKRPRDGATYGTGIGSAHPVGPGIANRGLLQVPTIYIAKWVCMSRGLAAGGWDDHGLGEFEIIDIADGYLVMTVPTRIANILTDARALGVAV